MPESSISSNNLNEQFARETISVGLPWRLLTFSLVLFIFSFFIYAGLRFGYRTYITSEAERIDTQIQELGNTVTAEEQESFIDFYSQLVNLERVLNRHDFSGNIFRFLERTTLGGVYYTDAEFTASEGALLIKGVSASSASLVQQLTLFDEASEIDRVIVNETQSDNIETTFTLTVFFVPDFFNTPTL